MEKKHSNDMKRYSILIISLVFCISACEGFLGKAPISSLTSDLFWKTQDDVEAAKATMYSSMATAMNSNFFNWGEIRGNNWGSNESNGITQDQLRTHDIPNTHNTTRWTDLYATVNRANLIIKYVPKMTVPDKDAIAQAYTMRALAYFWLTRVWGDVPIFTEAIEEYDVTTCLKERRPQSEVLELIEKDLETAEEYFPDFNAIATRPLDRTYLNLACVYALGMDLFAWMHRYEEVISVWENNISNLPFSKYSFKKFVSSDTEVETYMKWRSIVTDGTEDLEVFFALHYDKKTDSSENNTRKMFRGTSRYISVNGATLAAFEDGDIRKLGTFNFNGYTTYTLEKFWEPGGALRTADPSDNDLIMYRYTDLMLLYAEALADQDRPEEAVELVNLVRRRAGVIDLEYEKMSDQDIKNAILKERRLELLCEGKYWFDIVRTGNLELVNCPANRVYWPVHIDHISQNDKIKQTVY